MNFEGDVLQTTFTNQWECLGLQNPQLFGAQTSQLTAFALSGGATEKVFDEGPGAGTGSDHVLMHTSSGLNWTSTDLNNLVTSAHLPLVPGGLVSFLN